MEHWVSGSKVASDNWIFIALLAGCLSFQLPETNNEPMTTTIDEFEQKYGRKTVVETKDGIDNDGYQEDKF